MALVLLTGPVQGRVTALVEEPGPVTDPSRGILAPFPPKGGKGGCEEYLSFWPPKGTGRRAALKDPSRGILAHLRR